MQPLTSMSTGFVYRLHCICPPVRTPWTRQPPSRRDAYQSLKGIHVAALLHDPIHRHLGSDQVHRRPVPAAYLHPHPMDANHDLDHARRRGSLLHLLLLYRHLCRAARPVLLAPLRSQSSQRPRQRRPVGYHPNHHWRYIKRYCGLGSCHSACFPPLEGKTR